MKKKILLVIRICHIINPDGTEKIAYEIPKKEGSNELHCVGWYDTVGEMLESIEDDTYEMLYDKLHSDFFR